MSEEIWLPFHDHFGDLWASTSYFLGMSVRRRHPLYVSVGNLPEEKKQLLRDMVDLMDSPGCLVFTDAPPTHELEGAHMWHAPYAPLRRLWHPHERHHCFTYQFDGVCQPANTNPPPEEAAEILRVAEKVSGLPGVVLGAKHGVKVSAAIAATSAFFVGVDSGMAHLIHSVGTPCFLLRYRYPLDVCHRGKAFTECIGAAGFADRIQHHYFCVNPISPARKPS